MGEWLYRVILGIAPQEESPGYRRFIVCPRPGGGLTYASGAVHTVRGEIAIHWRCEGEDFHLEVTVPPNTTATVYVPTRDAASVREGDLPAAEAAGVRFLRAEERAAVYAVGAGNYRFTAQRG